MFSKRGEVPAVFVVGVLLAIALIGFSDLNESISGEAVRTRQRIQNQPYEFSPEAAEPIEEVPDTEPFERITYAQLKPILADPNLGRVIVQRVTIASDSSLNIIKTSRYSLPRQLRAFTTAISQLEIAKAIFKITVNAGRPNQNVFLVGDILEDAKDQNQEDKSKKTCTITCKCQKCASRTYTCIVIRRGEIVYTDVSPPECTVCKPEPPKDVKKTYTCGEKSPECTDVCEENSDFSYYPPPNPPSDTQGTKCQIAAEKECDRRNGDLKGSSKEGWTTGKRQI